MSDLRPATFDDCGTPGTVIYDGHMWHTHCPDCGSAVWEFVSHRIPHALDNHRKYACPEPTR